FTGKRAILVPEHCSGTVSTEELRWHVLLSAAPQKNDMPLLKRVALSLSAVLSIFVLAHPASGQTAAPASSRTVSQAKPRVTAAATRTTEAPKIDGNLDEAIWQQAGPLANFVQAEPFEGQPATELTEVRVLYDDLNLYIGAICYDSDPSQIIVSDARRDASMSDMDSFQVILDTFHDRQNGFIFGTNPAGAQYDAQVRNEGESNSTGR